MTDSFKTIQDPDLERFAKECVIKRTYVGWSQDDVAKRAGLSRAAVANIESGNRTGSFSSAVRIARVLNIDVMSILYGDKWR